MCQLNLQYLDCPAVPRLYLIQCEWMGKRRTSQDLLQSIGLVPSISIDVSSSVAPNEE